jgi:uncharacterized protein YtpQ (UPF0354 family)
MTVFSTLSSWLGGTTRTRRLADMAAFRAHVIAAIEREPDVDEVVANASDPAKFEIRMGARSATGDLTNTFGHLKAYPNEDVDSAVARIVRSVIEPKPTTVSADSIVALIRSQDYIDLIAKTGTDIYHEPFGADLDIVYMVDRPDSMLSITCQDVQQLNLPSLRQAAYNNLRRQLAKLVADDRSPVGVLYYVEGNTMLSTSLLLLEEFWRSIATRFPGDVLIALPRKDQLFIFDAAHPEAMSVARRLIEVTTGENFNLLSPHLYARRGGGRIVRVED